MKQVILNVILLYPTLLLGQELLCEQQPIVVYFVVNKFEEGKDDDAWKIYLDIQNRGTEDLFYAQAMNQNPLTDMEFFPGYLKIEVENATGKYAHRPHYLHGGLTFQVSTDSAPLFKVGTKRHEKTFVTRIPKGELPQVTGSFIVTLVTKDKISSSKIKK